MKKIFIHTTLPNEKNWDHIFFPHWSDSSELSSATTQKVYVKVVKEVQFAATFIKLFFWTLHHISLRTLDQERRCSNEPPATLADPKITTGYNSAQTCIIKPFRESLEWDSFKCSHVITSASLTLLYIYIQREAEPSGWQRERNMAYTLKVIHYTGVRKHFLIKKSPLHVISYAMGYNYFAY